MRTALKYYKETFQDACRQKNLRVTPQRMGIYVKLAQAVDHPSAEVLHQRLLKTMPTLSLDTVYRTLTTLVENGLVRRVETIESQARFEVTHSQHHHLICKHCKNIQDFKSDLIPKDDLAEQLRSWGRIESKNFVVYGTCKDCLRHEDDLHSL